MPILPNIGRKSPRIRAVIIGIYAFLIACSITTIYPLLLMLSGSVKGYADINDRDAFPRILLSEQARFARFQTERYGSLSQVGFAYGKDLLEYEEITIPSYDEAELRRFERFLSKEEQSLPAHFYTIQEYAPQEVLHKAFLRNYRELRDEVREECGTIDEVNRRYGLALGTWNDFPVFLESAGVGRFTYDTSKLTDRLLQFKRARSLNDKALLNMDSTYLFNQTSGTDPLLVNSGGPYRILKASCPSGIERPVWEEYVRSYLNPLFVSLNERGLRLFRGYLRKRFSDDIASVNRSYETSFKRFDDITADSDQLRIGALYLDYGNYIHDECPAECIRLDTINTRYRDFVHSPDAESPILAHGHHVFRESRSQFMLEMMTRSYKTVVQYILVYGRSVVNTIILIALLIAATLTVNPLAAYALSRYNLKNTYSILMFFLITMAFPGAVTMIPSFLMLKQFHLLNSFWALVLPAVANGYAIFILKGFFDSIPREVYESAQLDGAGEWTMFWRFTMALSKPVLALLTLNAFVGAYTAFIFALIVCPDEKMWTLMVWLYQLQKTAHPSVMYAALVVASIPTLLIFALAQNVIIRGIVIPVEK